MPDQLRIENWERVVTALKAFGASEVAGEGDEVRLVSGTAHLSVSRDATFTAGMALHDIEGGAAETVVVDHEAGAVTLVGDSVEYTFRRPER